MTLKFTNSFQSASAQTTAIFLSTNTKFGFGSIRDSEHGQRLQFEIDSPSRFIIEFERQTTFRTTFLRSTLLLV